MSIDAIVKHPTLRLSDLHPSKSPSFSPNLHRYMHRFGIFMVEGGVVQTVFRVVETTHNGHFFPGELLIGLMDGDRWFMGARLMTALTMGVEAHPMAYPNPGKLEEVPNFWAEYIEKGRCAIDPGHTMEFRDVRFREQGGIRHCLWCGAAAPGRASSNVARIVPLGIT